MLDAIDAVCSHPELLVDHYAIVLANLLPALSAAGACWSAAVALHAGPPQWACIKSSAAAAKFQVFTCLQTPCWGMPQLCCSCLLAGLGKPRALNPPLSPPSTLQWPASERLQTRASAASSCCVMWYCRRVGRLDVGSRGQAAWLCWKASGQSACSVLTPLAGSLCHPCCRVPSTGAVGSFCAFCEAPTPAPDPSAQSPGSFPCSL